MMRNSMNTSDLRAILLGNDGQYVALGRYSTPTEPA